MYEVICIDVRRTGGGGLKTRNVDIACRGRCPFYVVPPPPTFQMLASAAYGDKLFKCLSNECNLIYKTLECWSLLCFKMSQMNFLCTLKFTYSKHLS